MEKSREREFNDSGSIFASVGAAIARRKSSPRVLCTDIAVALVALVFVRSPLVFGAHPLAVALLSVLPAWVLAALAGTVVGALTLGEGGIVYAMTAIIVVFLRLIISSSTKTGASALFGEGILLRMSVAVIGGFAVAVYEILLEGFSLTAVLFGITMVIAPPLVALALAGVFEYGDNALRLIMSAAPVLRENSGRALYFKVSVAVLLFLVSFCTKEYSALGISVSYLIATFCALFAARSFGAVYGAAAGFVSSVAVSGSHAAGFMLSGLVAGIFAQLGGAYSAVFGGVALAVFSAYVGGPVGFAEVLPEYAAAAALSYPILKKVRPQPRVSEEDGTERSAIDMIGTMALAYKASRKRGASSVAPIISSLSSALRAYRERRPQKEDLISLVYGVIRQHVPYAENDENITKIATKLYNNEGISRSDLAYLKLSDEEGFEVFEDIKRMCEHLYVPSAPSAEELLLLSQMIKETAAREEALISMNEPATDALEAALAELGLSDFTARVFGDEQRHIILAGRDADGSVITSSELRRAITNALGAELSEPEYFRRGGMVLMECSECPKYSVSYATAGAVFADSEVSGDVSRKIDADGRFYAVISDGMGSGTSARRSSEFVASYLAATLRQMPPTDTLVHLLNSYLLGGAEECSATLDLFELNLFNKEAVFIKSGGAPSYVKRGSSIFRIRSATAPLGIMSSIDTEKIKVQVEAGDYVIMTSDGTHGIPEDAPWLLELMSAAAPKSARELADAILSAAVKRGKQERDDITVTVLHISKRA